MNLMILDNDLDFIATVDAYKSFLWVDRYYTSGDFELYAPMSSTILDIIKTDYYIQRPGSDRTMIIEDIKIDTDAEDGNFLTVTGRSLESILDRRIIWSQTTIDGNLQNGIKKLLNDAIISPSKPERRISNFIFKASTDPLITGLTIKAQYTGDNLYDVISSICKDKEIGFKVTLNDEKQFVFELYAGTDRSYEQMKVPYVIFSPKFDNILNSNYFESKANFKNVALVGGEGEGSNRKFLAIGNKIGLSRRELFVDARDISSDVSEGETLTPAQYNDLLKQRGNGYLSEYTEIVTFEGKIETTRMYKYEEDFFDGDIIQIENEYGHETTARLLEIIISEDEKGLSIYPTLKTIKDKEEQPTSVEGKGVRT